MMLRALIKTFAKHAFSFPILLAVLLVGGTFLATEWEGVVGGRLFTQGDTWWHAAVGEQILQTGAWPVTDSYSYTAAGREWFAYEWLGEIVVALAMRWGGLQGLAILMAGMSAVLMLLLYYYASLRSGNSKAAFAVCAVILPLAATLFSVRPVVFGWIFLLITLICLERFRQGQRAALLFVPVVFLVWVNTHGSFPMGLFAVGLCWLSGLGKISWSRLRGEAWTRIERRDLGLTMVACAPMLLVTPYGARSALYPFKLMFFQGNAISHATEWMPLPLTEVYARFFVVLLIVFLLYQVLFRVLVYRPDEFVFLLFALYSAFRHQRFLLLAAISMTPLMAAMIAPSIPSYQKAKDRRGLNAALSAFVVWGMVALIPSSEALNRRLESSYPKGAVEYLRSHQLSGRMVNEAIWGGYLIWTFAAERRVFIDGRIDLYADAGVLDDYVRFMSLHPATMDLLGKYDPEVCLFASGAPLGIFLKSRPDWQEVYADGVSMLLVKKAR